jgi:hypothetical protein
LHDDLSPIFRRENDTLLVKSSLAYLFNNTFTDWQNGRSASPSATAVRSAELAGKYFLFAWFPSSPVVSDIGCWLALSQVSIGIVTRRRGAQGRFLTRFLRKMFLMGIPHPLTVPLKCNIRPSLPPQRSKQLLCRTVKLGRMLIRSIMQGTHRQLHIILLLLRMHSISPGELL